MKRAIGIDLGTTYSCVAVWINGNVEIIANTEGYRTTPSYVAFTEKDILIGDAAKNQASFNSTNTIFDAKRLIGRKYDDPKIQNEKKNWPFAIIDQENKPYFKVKYQNDDKILSPEQVSSMVLSKMKQIASSYLGEEIKDAVITVPAYFNDAQRQATKDAGTIAGLNVIRIINEPTAAALAYGLDKRNQKETNILIFDNGGGTHDITLLTLSDGVFKVRATGGDTHLGGEDYDNRLVDWCVDDFKKQYGLNPRESSKAIRKLRTACEKVKKILSSSIQATIEVDALFQGIDYQRNINRARFEEICMDLFRRTIDPIDRVLKDAGVDKNKVDEIVLVGGSTRIPKLREMLSQYFGGKTLNENVNPDEAVAYGAAIQAAILSGQNDEKLNDIVLVDVIPLSLGLETVGGIMTNIVDRNTTIPCKRSKIFSTHSDNQTTVTIQIYEGERKFTKDNDKLGNFNLEDIPPAPRGIPQIEVIFDIDANGILNVKAIDKSSHKTKNITITNTKNRLSDEQIERMIEEAKKFEKEDLLRKEAIDARNELENYIYNIKQTLINPDIKNYISENILTEIEGVCQETVHYIDQNFNETKEVYHRHKKVIEDMWNPIITKIYQSKSEEKAYQEQTEEQTEEEN